MKALLILLVLILIVLTLATQWLNVHTGILLKILLWITLAVYFVYIFMKYKKKKETSEK